MTRTQPGCAPASCSRARGVDQAAPRRVRHTLDDLDARRRKAFEQCGAARAQRDFVAAAGDRVLRQSLFRQPDAAVQHAHLGARVRLEHQHLLVAQVDRAHRRRFPAHRLLPFVRRMSAPVRSN